MNLKPDHKTIYLVQLDDEWAWCDDPAPDPEMEPKDAIEYVRADVVREIEKRSQSALDDLIRAVYQPELSSISVAHAVGHLKQILLNEKI